MTRCLLSLIEEEIQGKTTMLITAHFLEWLEEKKIQNPDDIGAAADDDRQLELSYTTGKNAERSLPLQNTLATFFFFFFGCLA